MSGYVYTVSISNYYNGWRTKPGFSQSDPMRSSQIAFAATPQHRPQGLLTLGTQFILPSRAITKVNYVGLDAITYLVYIVPDMYRINIPYVF
jgi:hypothetical protein